MDKDIHFLRMAETVAKRSKCASRQIGAVLVKEGSVVSEGYNGAPRGVNMCQDQNAPCLRRKIGFKSGEGLEHCPAVHAEMNAIVQAARNGINIKDAEIFCFCGLPCKWCMSMIINAGIKRIVCLDDTYSQDNVVHILSSEIAKQAGIKIDFYSLKSDEEKSQIEDVDKSKVAVAGGVISSSGHVIRKF